MHLFCQFALFDLDKDGHIDYHELKVALKALGFELPKQEILAILQTHGYGPTAILFMYHQFYAVLRGALLFTVRLIFHVDYRQQS